MPAGSLHTEQAQHNLDFLQSFYSKHLYNDWAVTVSFYTALHIVENAIFVQKKFKFKGYDVVIEHAHKLPEAIAAVNHQLASEISSANDHELRMKIVQESYADIAWYYRTLFNESQTARYQNYKFTNANTVLIVKPSLNAIIDWSNKNYKTAFKVSL